MDDMGILPSYTGTCKHDGLNSYFKYTNCHYSLCNDHHLRELKWVIENERQTWARRMYDLPLNAKAAADEAKDNSKTCLEMDQLIDFERSFSNIIALGYHENPFFIVWPRSKGQRGRLKKTKMPQKGFFIQSHEVTQQADEIDRLSTYRWTVLKR